MTTRGKPSGFVAKCQCGAITAALDYERMDRKDVARMLGEWLMDGCTVEPRLGGRWSETITACTCSPKQHSGEQGG